MCCSRRCGFAYRDAKRAKRKAEREQQERCDRLTERQSRKPSLNVSDGSQTRGRMHDRSTNLPGMWAAVHEAVVCAGIHNLCSDACAESQARHEADSTVPSMAQAADRARKMAALLSVVVPSSV